MKRKIQIPEQNFQIKYLNKENEKDLSMVYEIKRYFDNIRKRITHA